MSSDRTTAVLDRLEQFEHEINALRDVVSRVMPGTSNGNVLRVEGAGTIWNGIAIGLALAGVIFGSVWIHDVSADATVAARQAEAYHKAVYALAPRFAEAVDKELDRQEENETP